MGVAAGVAGLSDTTASMLGYAGGSILALCLIPQIVQLVRTKSAKDIALSWALLYALGITLTMVYLIHVHALAAWIPLVIELGMALTVIVLKLLFDSARFCGRRHNGAVAPSAPSSCPSCHAAASAKVKADASGCGDVEDPDCSADESGLAHAADAAAFIAAGAR